MKKFFFLLLAGTFLQQGFSQSITALPDTINSGDNINILFSGNGVTFQQATSTGYCELFYFTQGTSTNYIDGTDFQVANATHASSTFNFSQATVCGSYDLYLVNYCSGQPMVLKVADALYVRCFAAGVREIENSLNFWIGPNPVINNEFRIMVDALQGEYYELRLLDMTGKQVYKESLRKGSTLINTGNLAKGIYTAVLNDGKNSKTTKVIVSGQ